jgi:hypothetical protein
VIQGVSLIFLDGRGADIAFGLGEGQRSLQRRHRLCRLASGLIGQCLEVQYLDLARGTFPGLYGLEQAFQQPDGSLRGLLGEKDAGQEDVRGAGFEGRVRFGVWRMFACPLESRLSCPEGTRGSLARTPSGR